LNEKSQRDQLESNEISLRQEVHEIHLQLEQNEKKFKKLEKIFQQERELWERERREREENTSNEIDQLKVEKEELRVQCQVEIKNKITELSMKFNHIQRDMEVTSIDFSGDFYRLHFAKQFVVKLKKRNTIK
jgi:hypothetical protein